MSDYLVTIRRPGREESVVKRFLADGDMIIDEIIEQDAQIERTERYVRRFRDWKQTYSLKYFWRPDEMPELPQPRINTHPVTNDQLMDTAGV